MRATKFEFEQRFWVIGFIFAFGFFLYNIDKTNAALWLLHVAAPPVNPDSDHGNNLARLIFGAGALLVFLAAAFRTWATAYLKTEVVHDQAQHSEDLVADGPYRHLRNPLYFANLAMAAGLGLLASRAGWIFMVVAMWLFMYRLIFREEDGLLRTQGESYRAYLNAVPRFWPALTPRIPSAGEEPRWGQAFAGESLIWLFGLGELVFAITLNFKLMWIVFGVSFVAYFLSVYVIKKRAAAEKS
jgi:protein-S-isoprenylcysteine O-methyltransferase Ste14